MDLNPLSTPNKVLTDCINGTFITYNGNEFSLQNDQGNYKLEYCRLTPNYIPVGIKEYGDILYIVSQNPLTNSVEIGSYPSPLMVTVPDERENNNDFNSIIKEQILDKGLTEGIYTELMENADNILFNGDDYKLNPGDEYCLQTEGDKFPYKYETIEYHILDEDSNVHNVTNKIVLDENGNPKNFQYVAWTVPGWLSIKSRLVELSVAGINVRSFYVPRNESNKTAHFAFNLRLNVNDQYLMKKNKDGVSILNKWCTDIEKRCLDDVRFRVFIEKEEHGEFKSIYDSEFVEFGITDEISANIPKNFFLNEFDWTEWYGDSRVLWRNISGKIENLNQDDRIRVRMIPVLYEQQYNYKIIYDNLEQSLLFDLASVEDNEWDLGNELYQFYLNSDKTTQYIYTNISGPMISSFPVNLYGDIYDIKGNKIKTLTFEEYSGIGENVLQIPFDDTFKPENIYVIQFKFAPSEKEIGNFPIVTRFLITSEVFNDFTDVMMYDRDIKFDEWIKRYWAHNKTEFELNYKDVDIQKTIGTVDTCVYENNTGNTPTSSDIKYASGKSYNTFFDDQNSGLSNVIKYRKGFEYTFEYNTKITEESLSGDLWDGFNPINNLMMMDYSTNTKIPFKQFESIDPENPKYTSITISAYIELLCKYQKMGLPFNFADTDFWYFSDNLENLKPNGRSIFSKSDGKLEDYVYEVDIQFFGRKMSDKDADRTINVAGKLLKSNVKVGYSFNKFIDSGAGVKVSVDSYNEIYKAIVGKKLPCLLVKVNYMLAGKSDNYELVQTIAGGPNDGDITSDFTFRKQSDTTFTRYYIAFAEQDKPIPVLIPLGLDETGNTYFKNFCKKVSVSLKDVNSFIPTDRYILNIDSTTQYDPRLTIYNVGKFSNLIYNNIDLSNRQSRILLVTSLKNKLKLESELEYRSILIDCKDEIENAMLDDSFVVFDKFVATVSFNSENYPYVSLGNMKGINEIKMELIRLSSNSDSDFQKWNNSPQLNEGGNIIGLYCDDAIKSEDFLLQELSSGYLYNLDKSPCIYVSGKSFVKTDGITESAIKHKWRDEDEDSIINDKFHSRAMWFVYHNWWNSGAEGDNYVRLGGCLKSDPDIRLDFHWLWIK